MALLISRPVCLTETAYSLSDKLVVNNIGYENISLNWKLHFGNNSMKLIVTKSPILLFPAAVEDCKA